MAEEMRLHLELQADENIAAGMSPDEARFTAQKQFGHIEGIKELCRDQRSWLWIEQILQDLRYAIRRATQNTRFTTFAVLNLALGIGAIVALFNVTNNTLFDPYAYKRSHEIWCPVVVGVKAQHENYTLFEDYLKIARLPAVASAIVSTRNLVVATGDFGTEFLDVVQLSDRAFEFLGVPPILGRSIGPADFSLNHEPAHVAVLTYLAWQHLYLGDPNIIGRHIRLDNERYTVVGVAAPRFTWKTRDGLFIPTKSSSAGQWVSINIRLKPGFTPKEAANEITVLYQHLFLTERFRFPKDGIEVKFPNLVGIGFANGQLSSSLYLLLFSAVFLFLIACTNVTNLKLARGIGRQREFAIRMALGSSRGRLIRQLLTESLLLTLAASFVACAFSYKLTDCVFLMIPTRFIPYEAVVQMSGSAFLLAFALSALTSVIISIPLALQYSRIDPNQALKDGSNATSAKRGPSSYGRASTMITIALSFILVYASILSFRVFLRLSSVNYGFRSDHIIQVKFQLPWDFYSTSVERMSVIRKLSADLSRQPGIHEVAVGAIPYTYVKSRYTIPGYDSFRGAFIAIDAISDNYLRLLGITMRGGSAFTSRDFTEARHVAVINEAFAKSWPNHRSPLGQNINLDMLKQPSLQSNPPSSSLAGQFTIMGIVSDSHTFVSSNETPPIVYVPYETSNLSVMPTLSLLTSIDPISLLSVVRTRIRLFDPNIAIVELNTADSLIGEHLKQPIFNMILFGTLSTLGLVLAWGAMYSVLVYQLNLRTHEFSVRLALGARSVDLFGCVIGEGINLLLFGLLGGAGICLMLPDFVTTKVFFAPLLDPWSFVITFAVLGTSCLLLCLIPARRAMKIDPHIALRSE